VGLDLDTVFTHPQIQVWRSIPERENCTLDAALADGSSVRLHIKRHRAVRSATTPAADEAVGIQLLQAANVPTVSLVAWGRLPDGRSFLITEDLAGYQPLDKLIVSGTVRFDTVCHPVADLAAKLHLAGLHHRDLYLCHLFAKVESEPGSRIDLRLIDAGRVKHLPRLWFTGRWIVKDLAQLWYSTLSLPVTDDQRLAMLARYSIQRGLPSPLPLRLAVERKSRSIARHDAKLRRQQPTRNISIPAAR
jgi:hypothetical protein